ncbi:MAG: hypothetical protein ABI780_14520 [Ardenticatenales bacterium]
MAEFSPSHVVTEGWAGRRNGALLLLMRAAGFTVFVTVDRNLVFQQDVSRSGIAVIVMHALSNRVPDLRPLAPSVVAAIAAAKAGDVVHVGGQQ